MSGSRSGWYLVGQAIRQIIASLQRPGSTASSRKGASPTLLPKPQPQARRDSAPEAPSPGQYGDGATRDLRREEIQNLRFEYAPNPDRDPDPGEVVWTWVPYAENDGRGKDRPVLIIARIDAESVAGCYLSTKFHEGFVNVGTGGWDGQRRDSFMATDRILRITESGMRREGHALDRDRFIEAARAIASQWQLRG